MGLIDIRRGKDSLECQVVEPSTHLVRSQPRSPLVGQLLELERADERNDGRLCRSTIRACGNEAEAQEQRTHWESAVGDEGESPVGLEKEWVGLLLRIREEIYGDCAWARGAARRERASGFGGAGSPRRKATGTGREDITVGKETVFTCRIEIAGGRREGEECSSMRSGSWTTF
jgi:hypothetical protein